MKRLLLALLFLCGTALAQTAPVTGYCNNGGTFAAVSGLNSTNYLQGLFPGCTITVYNHGTTTPANPIYADSNNTPLSNPFTANAYTSPNSGGWIFWAATGLCYDVVGNGGTPFAYSAPVTLTEVCLGSTSSSTGSTRECEPVWGGSGSAFALQSGDDAIANRSCPNCLDTAHVPPICADAPTETIVGVYCSSDAGSNTTTINPTFGAAGSGTSICSTALTCGSSGAYSASCTVSHGALIGGDSIDPVMGGTLTGTSIHVLVVYTVPVL